MREKRGVVCDREENKIKWFIEVKVEEDIINVGASFLLGKKKNSNNTYSINISQYIYAWYI